MKLNRPTYAIDRERECEATLEANITAIGQFARMFRDGTNPPLLTHPSNHASNPEAEGDGGSNTHSELLALVIEFRAVAAEATLEDEVVCDRDAGVNGEPVGDDIHEVHENQLEV